MSSCMAAAPAPEAAWYVAAMRRTMRLTLWIGHSGTMAMIVEQFGLAMMPWCWRMASGLISGMTSGTFGSMRKADELSTTTAPAWAAMGANFFEIDPPAEKKAMS